MKWIGFLLLLAVTLLSSACGGSSSAEKIDGVWMAQLNDSSGTPLIAFTAALKQAGTPTLMVTTFNFGVAQSCFPSSTFQTATFTRTGDFQGIPTGPFTMFISTISPGGQNNNILLLQGTVTASTIKGENISGAWRLTGQSGCDDSGTFVMLPRPPV